MKPAGSEANAVCPLLLPSLANTGTFSAHCCCPSFPSLILMYTHIGAAPAGTSIPLLQPAWPCAGVHQPGAWPQHGLHTTPKPAAAVQPGSAPAGQDGGSGSPAVCVAAAGRAEHRGGVRCCEVIPGGSALQPAWCSNSCNSCNRCARHQARGEQQQQPSCCRGQSGGGAAGGSCSS